MAVNLSVNGALFLGELVLERQRILQLTELTSEQKSILTTLGIAKL